MKDCTACFTGHRVIDLSVIESVQTQTNKMLEKLIDTGYRYFFCGGAMGFDMLAAQAVLRMWEQYVRHIGLLLALPYPEQAVGWSVENSEMYMQIKEAADKVIYTSGHYHRGCMFIRNRYMVDNSSWCISYQTNDKGGTAYTVNYARIRNIPIINIAELI